jgi:hypothetical protein
MLAVLAVVLVHAVLALVVLLDTSISLDFNALINIAFQIINALWPLFVVPMGFLFGLRLIGWIMEEIRASIPGK